MYFTPPTPTAAAARRSLVVMYDQRFFELFSISGISDVIHFGFTRSASEDFTFSECVFGSAATTTKKRGMPLKGSRSECGESVMGNHPEDVIPDDTKPAPWFELQVSSGCSGKLTTQNKHNIHGHS